MLAAVSGYQYQHLQQTPVIVMEATSDYWKPFYFLMEGELPVALANARHVKGIPGRKTDVSDAPAMPHSGQVR